MNLDGLSRKALEEYTHNLEAKIEGLEAKEPSDTEEPTDIDLIVGHPFQGTGQWGDVCEHASGGWICGYSRAEHVR